MTIRKGQHNLQIASVKGKMYVKIMLKSQLKALRRLLAAYYPIAWLVFQSHHT